MRATHVKAWDKLRRAFGDSVGDIPSVQWSSRMTKTAGLAYIEEGFIRLSSPVFWKYPEGFILEIVPHELAHIAAWRRFKEGGHGKAWKDCMLALGLEPHRLWEPARMLQHRVNFWKDK